MTIRRSVRARQLLRSDTSSDAAVGKVFHTSIAMLLCGRYAKMEMRGVDRASTCVSGTAKRSEAADAPRLPALFKMFDLVNKSLLKPHRSIVSTLSCNDTGSKLSKLPAGTLAGSMDGAPWSQLSRTQQESLARALHVRTRARTGSIRWRSS